MQGWPVEANMKHELDCYRLISNSSKIQSAIQEHHYFACFSVSTSFFKGRICLEISNRNLTSLEPRKISLETSVKTHRVFQL